MSVAKQLPAPRQNLTMTGIRSLASDVASTDIKVAVGDYTGGASEDLFTLSAHGLVDGDVVFVVAQSAQGAITGGPGTRCIVNELSSSTFQVQNAAGSTIENTADGTVTFLKASKDTSQDAADLIRSQIIVALNDTTGGTVEDMLVAYSGNWDIAEADSIKLLYKATGAANSAVDVVSYVKDPVAAATAFYFQTAATAGGAVLDTTGDGLTVWLKTS